MFWRYPDLKWAPATETLQKWRIIAARWHPVSLSPPGYCRDSNIWSQSSTPRLRLDVWSVHTGPLNPREGSARMAPCCNNTQYLAAVPQQTVLSQADKPYFQNYFPWLHLQPWLVSSLQWCVKRLKVSYRMQTDVNRALRRGAKTARNGQAFASVSAGGEKRWTPALALIPSEDANGA